MEMMFQIREQFFCQRSNFGFCRGFEKKVVDIFGDLEKNHVSNRERHPLAGEANIVCPDVAFHAT